MNAVALPAELEQFANQAVALGRFQNVQEVVTAALRLLQRAESARAALEPVLKSRSGESAGVVFRAPERSGLLAREHRSTGKPRQMAAGVDFSNGLVEASLDEAVARGEREGFLTIEEVEREMDELIEATVRARA